MLFRGRGLRRFGRGRRTRRGWRGRGRRRRRSAGVPGMPRVIAMSLVRASLPDLGGLVDPELAGLDDTDVAVWPDRHLLARDATRGRALDRDLPGLDRLCFQGAP